MFCGGYAHYCFLKVEYKASAVGDSTFLFFPQLLTYV